MAAETSYEAYQDKEKHGYSDSPVLGQSRDSAAQHRDVQDVRVRYFVGTLTNENDVLMLEEIMTRSLRCKDQLNEVGDILVLSEQGTFDKEGCYNIVVKYMELVDKSAWVSANGINESDV